MPPRPDRTATITNVVETTVKRMLNHAHVLLPARVMEYDPDKQTCSAQPLLKYTPINGGPELLPIIHNIPVMFPRIDAGDGGPKAHIYMPMKPGSTVALMFADKSMDKWKSLGGEVDPLDLRSHALSDAVALPGLFPLNNPIENVDPSDLRIQLKWPERSIDSEIYLGGDTGDVVLRASNMVRLGAGDAAQSAVLGDLLKTWLDAHVHSTGIGPSGPPTVPLPDTTLSTKVKVKDNT